MGVLGIHAFSMPAIDMPADFPNRPYDDVYQRLANALAHQQPQHSYWPEYSAAWAGLMYRFRSCAEHDEAFTESVNEFGDTPGRSERYNQERNLFGFFVTGLSAIECACYGLFAIGSMLHPTGFPFTTDEDRSNVNPKKTRNKYQNAFPKEGITRALQRITNEQQYENWKGIRNVLAHRSNPGRIIYGSIRGPANTTEWVLQGIPIDSTTTASRREWLANSLRDLMTEADHLTAKHF